MNLQTERIENHRAQLTIEIEDEQLESAKQRAAREISRRVRVKGFRKGKAPYRLVAQAVGEAAILEEAVESLSDVIYKQALEESEVAAYGPGTVEDFKMEPPTFVFSVPLQPEVDLGDYRGARVDFEEPQVSDEELDGALEQLRMRELEVLDGEREIAEAGNRVRVAVESEFVDGEEPDDESEPTAESDADKPYAPRKGDTFVHDENAIVILDAKTDPFVDGFVEALIGAELDEEVHFELTIPDDEVDRTIANRRVRFEVTIKQIEAILIPELDDAFAEVVSRNRGDEAQDMAGLRQSIREDLERAALERAKTQYSGEVLAKVVEGAEFRYPEMMLGERVEEMIKEFAGNLERQNLKLEDYLRYTGSSREALQEQYQEPAKQSLCQSLALRELAAVEGVEVGEELIALRIEGMMAGYGGSESMRALIDRPEMRSRLRGELFIGQVNERLYAIGRGEDPDMAIESFNEGLREKAKKSRERAERLQSAVDNQEEEDPTSPADPGAENEDEAGARVS